MLNFRIEYNTSLK